MTDAAPPADALRRGHVVLARDPFTDEARATRPQVVVNNELHPFDGQQYVTMALTSRTWYDNRFPLSEGDFRDGRTPIESSIVPHALASLQPAHVSDYVCRLAADPIDRAVARLETYLTAAP